MTRPQKEGKFKEYLKLWHENPSAWHSHEVDRWIEEAKKDFPHAFSKDDTDPRYLHMGGGIVDVSLFHDDIVKWYRRWFGSS